MANTLLKAGIVLCIGSPQLRRTAAVVLGVTAIVALGWLFYPMRLALP